MNLRVAGDRKAFSSAGRPSGTAGAVFLAAAVALASQSEPDWPQWGRDPGHTGAASVQGQPLSAILADVVYDPFVEQAKADTSGDLLAHYAVPLLDGSDVYMVFKTGQYAGLGSWDSQIWTVKKLRWSGATLREVWTFESDWRPEPLELTDWEAVFLPALAGDSIYVPGLGGTVHRVSKATGLSRGRINPFADVDPARYVAGGLAVAPDGGIVYTAIGLSVPDPGSDATGAWLVRIAPGGTGLSKIDFGSLVAGAPAPQDSCQMSFPRSERPWPPSPTAVPPSAPCGSQRPGINVVPAIAPDGTIYTLSRAHANDRYAYLVAVNADLTPAWAASLRGLLDDGCGVLVPINDTNTGCRTGARIGVDPATNDRPAGRVRDAGTASPVVLPDGAILVGTSSGYNGSRGHLFKFDSSGAALGSYDFGWDVTPAIRRHDGTYSIVLKDNHYFSPEGPPYYDVSSLDPNLLPEWSYRATNTESCAREPTGSVSCVDDHPDGFEWCVNQPAVDAAGVVYVNSEDGVLYAITADGRLRDSIFLDTALGAAYTPVSIGSDGRVYAQNNGHLFAVGFPIFPRESPQSSAPGGRDTRTVQPRSAGVAPEGWIPLDSALPGRRSSPTPR